MTTPRESTESSSPIITRAVAAGLNGKTVDNYEFPGWQKAVLLALGYLPQGAARFAISLFQSVSGLPPECLNNFSLDELIQARLNDYSACKGPFPAVVLGAGLGGATAYLSLALRAPFLPQAFVISLNKGSYSGDVQEYLQRSLEPALQIASKDPRLMTIQHFDPIHDGWLTRFVNHLRFKLVDLPEAYAEFIRQRVEPGGAVVYLEGGAEWLRYRLGERSVFQVGGWGDISASEFLDGSPRIKEYTRHTGLKSSDWSLDSHMWPLETGPESEWGSEPGLADALENFCKTEGFRFVRIHLPHPTDFSRLAFFAAKKLLEKGNRQPSGTLIECFSQFDSVSAMKSGLLPVWLIFNTEDSVRYLKEMSSFFPKEMPVFFSPLSTFSLTPDMASWQDWVDAIGRNFINIGTRESHYPADARALVKWAEPLRDWVMKNPIPVQSHLTADELNSLARQILA
jgi:hypothetical protein